MTTLKYLTGDPEPLLVQAQTLLERGKLGAALLSRYPDGPHDVRTDRALYQYVTDLKNTYLRNGDLINKVCLLYTSPSPRDGLLSRMPSSA